MTIPRQRALVGGYTVANQSEETFLPFFTENVKTVFGPTTSIAVKRLLSEAESQAVNTLRKNMGDPLSLYYGIYDENSVQVGWSFGFQTNAESFYMCNTGVLSEHRGRGIYSALLPIVIQDIAAHGFQVIYSRHTMTNNAVLIPKLRAGFVISQIELSDPFGTLVHLRYYTNAHRRHLMDYRCGEASLSDAVTAILAKSEDAP